MSNTAQVLDWPMNEKTENQNLGKNGKFSNWKEKKNMTNNVMLIQEKKIVLKKKMEKFATKCWVILKWKIEKMIKMYSFVKKCLENF